MCGFLGKVSKNSIEPTKLIDSNKYITCRGPDSRVIEESNYLGINYFLIFNRLSILDLSETANQPMFSTETQNILMFNGEIYNHKELRKNLIKKGSKFFTSHSDTEVILNGLDLEGIKFINKLRGQFSIFYFDKINMEFYLIRDRLGQKPLYYSLENNVLNFSSNLKSIISNTKNLNISSKSLDEYLRYGAISSPNTLFQNIFKVEPSTILKFEILNNEINFTKTKYWDICDSVSNKQFNSDEFLEIIKDAINIRYEADVPVASFLSGGIDSTLITKILSEKHKVNTFSVAVQNKKYDESRWSQLVSKKYNSNHSETTISSNFSTLQITDCLNSLDEPYADPSVIPSFIISKEISNHYKVAISGDGGDELLGGYQRTNLTLKNSKINENFINLLYYFYPAFLGSGSKILMYSKNKNVSYRSTLSDEKFLNLLNIESNDVSKNVNIDMDFGLYKAMLICDYKFYLPDQMLYKVDRTSMANSLEVRSPFVDHLLIEYIMSHTTPYLNAKIQKSIFKNYLIEDFDKDFINRKKQGFVFDIENWVYKNFNTIEESYKYGKVSSYLDIKNINKLNNFKSRINSHRIWKLFVLEHYLNSLKN